MKRAHCWRSTFAAQKSNESFPAEISGCRSRGLLLHSRLDFQAPTARQREGGEPAITRRSRR
jgi:hypothetical protein